MSLLLQQQQYTRLNYILTSCWPGHKAGQKKKKKKRPLTWSMMIRVDNSCQKYLGYHFSLLNDIVLDTVRKTIASPDDTTCIWKLLVRYEPS